MRAHRPLRLAFVLLTASLFVAGCGGPKGEPFPVDAYLGAPANLQGNRYSLDAEIDSQLEWTEGVGRLIAVKPLGRDLRLPVFIADDHKANLMVAQRYRFEVTVRKGGLLTVTDLRKL